MLKPKKVLILGSGELQVFRTGTEVGKTLNSIFPPLFRMPAEKILHFWDLPQTTRFELNDDFRKKLFSLANKSNQKDLSEKLRISYPFLSPLVRGVYSIPLKMLLNLSEFSGIGLLEIENSIKFTRTRHGGKASFKYPLIGNETISSLVGNGFGDGYISAKKRQFQYINFNPVLLAQIEEKIFSQFGARPISRKQDSLLFPSIIGDILLLFGAPVSPKLTSNTLIPEWIMNGSREVKRNFLLAIFDDDGSAMFSAKYRAKGVSISWTRQENHAKELEKLLLQVKELLSEFDILSGNPLIAKTKLYEDGNHITMYLNITTIKSIKNFHQFIGLSEGTKLNTLGKILSREYAKRQEIPLNNSLILTPGVNRLNGQT